MIWTKGAYQSGKFWTFNYPRKILTNIYFNGSFCWKYIKFSLKNYRGVVSHDFESWCKIWRRTDLLLQKWQEKIGEFSPKHPKFSKVCTFIDSCCAEYLMFYLKKYRGIIFQDTEDMQNLKKTDLWLGKWHEKYNTFSPEQLKVSKLGLWWDP